MISYPPYKMSETMKGILDIVHDYNIMAVTAPRQSGMTDAILHYLLNFSYNVQKPNLRCYYVASKSRVAQNVAMRLKARNISLAELTFTDVYNFRNVMRGKIGVGVVIFDDVPLSINDFNTIKEVRAPIGFKMIFANCVADFHFSGYGIPEFNF